MHTGLGKQGLYKREMRVGWTNCLLDPVEGNCLISGSYSNAHSIISQDAKRGDRASPEVS